MSNLKVLAGDFVKHSGNFFMKGWGDPGTFHLVSEESKKDIWNPVEKIPATEVEVLSLATEESVKKVGGTVGWGAAGAAVL